MIAGRSLVPRLLLFFILFISCASVAAASSLSGLAALEGMERVRIVVDLNASGDLLGKRAQLLVRTDRDLRQAGVMVEMVIAVRGGASRFLTRNPGDVAAEEQAGREVVQENLLALVRSGARIEQCAIAAAANGLAEADFLPAVTVVPNGYVSLIGYQQQGYALLPME